MDDWRYKVPYATDNPDFDAKHEGGCHCGKVIFHLSRETPLDSKFCHCMDCQVQHAAPYQWAAIFHKEDIKFVFGHSNLEWYYPEGKRMEHVLPCKVRCSSCRTPIMDEGRRMILLFPTLVRFESPEAKKKFLPRLHMFYDQRVMDIPDGLPKWSGMANESSLIAETPKA